MPATASVPPRSRAARAGGTSVPTGAKRMAASSGSGGAASASSGAGRSELEGQVLRLLGAGHDMDAGAAGKSDLGRRDGRSRRSRRCRAAPSGRLARSRAR